MPNLLSEGVDQDASNDLSLPMVGADHASPIARERGGHRPSAVVAGHHPRALLVPKTHHEGRRARSMET
jgi:hypothetical protein